MKRRLVTVTATTLATGLALAATAQAGTGYISPGDRNYDGTISALDYTFLQNTRPVPAGSAYDATVGARGALRLNSQGSIRYGISDNVTAITVSAVGTPCLNPADGSQYPTIYVDVRNGLTGAEQIYPRVISNRTGFQTYSFPLSKSLAPPSAGDNVVKIFFVNDFASKACDRAVAFDLVTYNDGKPTDPLGSPTPTPVPTATPAPVKKPS